jgi:replicative DNA helicase
VGKEIERPLPQDAEMEKALLGAILSGHKQTVEVLDLLRPDDFFFRPHAAIAKTILKLNAEGTKPDLLSVHDALSVSGELDTAGGIAYVSDLLNGKAFSSDILYIVRGLRRMAAFRQAVHLAENIKSLAMEQGGSVEELLDSAVEKFGNLAREIESTEDDGAPYFDSASEALATACQGTRLKIYTDIEMLDQWTGGFREQELVVVTAETGTGKSLLAAQIRARACRDGHHALFCSGEMSRSHLASRELASVSGVQPIKMRRDDLLTEDDFEALVDAAAHQCKQCRILDGELSLPRIRRAARKMKARTGLDLLILDYDELIEAEGKTEFEQQRAIARAAKTLAKELHCVVILISQLRKTTAGEDAGKPTQNPETGNHAIRRGAESHHRTAPRRSNSRG